MEGAGRLFLSLQLTSLGGGLKPAVGSCDSQLGEIAGENRTKERIKESKLEGTHQQLREERRRTYSSESRG